jgi:peptidoglycan/LPS O-acetylase OafA/YrhL
MGVLRLILAISVILTHSGLLFGYAGMGGLVAVETFFIASGFYMSLILNEKYIGNNSYKLFISNRLLKLLPVYWVVLILVIVENLLSKIFIGHFLGLGTYVQNFNQLAPFSFIFLVLTNIFMAGQDTVMFLQLRPSGMLEFCKNFWNSKPQLYAFLLVPQAWSLGVELLFYFIAPWIVRKRSLIIGIYITLSFTLRVFIYYNGLHYDPWIYRFFPTELTLFLLGAISYKIYKNLKNLNRDFNIVCRSICITAILITVMYPYIDGIFARIPLGHELFKWIYYIIMMISIPFMFIFTKHSKVDRFLADLSYPIYISHVFILSIITLILGEVFKVNTTRLLTPLGIVFTLLFSIILVKIVVNPIESIRQKRVKAIDK